jgi:hypothetical protein
VEAFHREVQVQQLRDRINYIHDARVAQIADGRKCQQQVNRMAQALNRLVRSTRRNVLTPQEQALFDKQQHCNYSQLTQVEQTRLKTEVDTMWNQIPRHLQDKAQELAGLR